MRIALKGAIVKIVEKVFSIVVVNWNTKAVLNRKNLMQKDQIIGLSATSYFTFAHFNRFSMGVARQLLMRQRITFCCQNATGRGEVDFQEVGWIQGNFYRLRRRGQE